MYLISDSLLQFSLPLLFDVYLCVLILFILVFVAFIVVVLNYFLELGEREGGALREPKKWFAEILYFSF